MPNVFLRLKSDPSKRYNKQQLYDEAIAKKPQLKGVYNADQILEATLKERGDEFEVEVERPGVGGFIRDTIGDFLPDVGKQIGGVFKLGAGLVSGAADSLQYPLSADEAKKEETRRMWKSILSADTVKAMAHAAKPHPVLGALVGIGARMNPAMGGVLPGSFADDLATVSDPAQWDDLQHSIRTEPAAALSNVAAIAAGPGILARAGTVGLAQAGRATSAVARGVRANKYVKAGGAVSKGAAKVEAMGKAAYESERLSRINEAANATIGGAQGGPFRALNTTADLLDPLTMPTTVLRPTLTRIRQGTGEQIYHQLFDPKPKGEGKAARAKELVYRGLSENIPIQMRMPTKPGAPVVDPAKSAGKFALVEDRIAEIDKFRDSVVERLEKNPDPNFNTFSWLNWARSEPIREAWDKFDLMRGTIENRAALFDRVNRELKSRTGLTLDPGMRPGNPKYVPGLTTFDDVFSDVKLPAGAVAAAPPTGVRKANESRKKWNEQDADARAAIEGAGRDEAAIAIAKQVDPAMTDALTNEIWKMAEESGAATQTELRAAGKSEHDLIEMRGYMDKAVAKSGTLSLANVQPYFVASGGLFAGGLLTGVLQPYAGVVTALGAIRSLIQHDPAKASKMAIELYKSHPQPSYWRHLSTLMGQVKAEAEDAKRSQGSTTQPEPPAPPVAKPPATAYPDFF